MTAEDGFYYDSEGTSISVAEWFRLVAAGPLFLGIDTVGDRIVCTMWLGIDHSQGTASEPLIYQTMVWDVNAPPEHETPFPHGDVDHRYDRFYPTRAGALEGHAQTLLMVRLANEHG